ncbi:MAG TPA: DUF4123 domain-containing protein [Gemmobacter sp.]|nr:DUF4123 domain-containing protein [Gemmobacter sp.]
MFRRTTTSASNIFALLDPHLWMALDDSLARDMTAFGAATLPLFRSTKGEADAGDSPWLVHINLPARLPESAPSDVLSHVFLSGLRRPAGIFLRSTATLGDMQHSLRKLTRLWDEGTQSWYVNRFWEPEFFVYFTSFLARCPLLEPLSHVTGYAVVIDGTVLEADCALAPEGGHMATAEDRATDLHLVFDAGMAMVGLRRARLLETNHKRGQDPVAVFDLARDRLSIEGLDYKIMCKCVDIAYVMRRFYADRAAEALPDHLVNRLFDETGEPTMALLRHVYRSTRRHPSGSAPGAGMSL